jgi:hypothetical protein
MTAAADLRAVKQAIAAMPKEMVRAGAKQLRKPLLDAFTRDTGGDRRLSGLRNSGRITVSTSVRGTDTVKGRVYAGPPTMRGPAGWLDRGTKRRRQGKGWHPGTPAKGTWTNTADKEADAAMRAMVAGI